MCPLFSFPAHTPFTFFLISWTYFPFSPSLTVSVSDFLGLPAPHPPPLTPRAPSLFPSLCAVGGGLVSSCCSDHFSRLSHLGQLVAFAAGQQTLGTHILRHTNGSWTAGSSATSSGFYSLLWQFFAALWLWMQQIQVSRRAC